MAPPADLLLDELVEEILLRIPPNDPASLLRAALVCKRWCRIISDPSFRRRFRERHRRAPVLGILRNFAKKGDLMTTHFVPTCSFSPRRAAHRGWRALDCRHGRVLLHSVRGGFTPLDFSLAVWDLVADELRKLPPVPCKRWNWRAAVLCAAAATGGGCDHLDCHRGPFLVVLMATYSGDTGELFSYVYSSETDVWSEQPSDSSHSAGFFTGSPRTTLVRNALYFRFYDSSAVKRILKYDLVTQQMTTIDTPPMWTDRTVLMTAEGGGLGSATVKGSQLYLWSWETGSYGDTRWMQIKVIELKMLTPVGRFMVALDVVSSADGNGVVFVGTNRGSFFADLKSGRIRKVRGLGGADNIVPYMSFYTPALEVVDLTSEDASDDTLSA
ncbi:hypothetical protein EJB05_14815, partial [Eragrostis curvula]